MTDTARMRWSLILTLAGKDWRLFWADRRAAALCFLVPILLASAFGLVFDRPNATDANLKLPLMVVVESDHPFVRRLADAVEASPRVEVTRGTRAEAERRVADRRPGVAVVFTDELLQLAQWTPGQAGSRPTLTVLHNPLCTTESQWAEGVLTEVLMREVATDRLGPWLGATAVTPPFRTVTEPLLGTQHTRFNAYSHSFCGMTLQYLLFWGMESGLLLLRERGRGVWLRVRAAPVPLPAVMLGKALATAGIAVLQVLTTFAFGYLVFGVAVGGSVIGFLLMVVTVSGLSAATGLLVAAVGGTEARARSVCVLVILSLSMFGGLWLPGFLLPGWARDLALSLPTTWAMRGLDGVTWQGQSFLGALPSAAVVTGFSAIFLTVAVARLTANEARRRRGGVTACGVS